MSRLRSIQILMGLMFLYLALVGFEIPMILRAGLGAEVPEIESTGPLISHLSFEFKFWQHARQEVNVELMKEAKFFGDIVIVPYMDNYDLVVLKTLAICEYGFWIVAAKYIMKCDDDTFVRIDAVMMEMKKIQSGKSFYIGNINYYHKPLRHDILEAFVGFSRDQSEVGMKMIP